MRNDLTDAKNVIEVLYVVQRDSGDFFSRLAKAGQREVQHIITLAGGFWRHNGEPKAPHAVLRSGKHSDGFVALPEALKYAAINDLFAMLLVSKIKAEIRGNKIDWVVGSDHAAATFSSAVANRLAKEYPHTEVKHDFTEKVMDGHGETQKWSRHVIGKEECVLHIEELCTTNLTLKRVRNGIAKAHQYDINYVPVVGMVVNRTGSNTFEESRIVSLLDITFNEWDVNSGEECQLCNGGSEALENVKKSAATWAKLNCR